MSHLLVLATAESRLHADLVIVRLKRAGIPTDLISIFHPRSPRPNSALCWIKGFAFLPMESGVFVTVSGALSRPVNEDIERQRHAPFAERMRALGLTREQGSRLENCLLEDRTVIAIEVDDEFNLPAIFHTFRGMAVQKVSMADVAPRGRVADPRLSRRYRPAPAPAAVAMAYGAAV